MLEENSSIYRPIDVEQDLLIPLGREIVFPKYLSPDLLNFALNFCKDCEFDSLLELVKIAIKSPQ